MQLIEIVVAIVLGLLICWFAGVVIRRRALLHGGGAVDMSLRAPGRRGAWALGIGRYTGDQLQWYRLFTFAPRPAWELSRVGLRVLGRRVATGQESWTVPAGSVILCCQLGSDEVYLAMLADAVAGFLSWIESAPPGYAMPDLAAG